MSLLPPYLFWNLFPLLIPEHRRKGGFSELGHYTEFEVGRMKFKGSWMEHLCNYTWVYCHTSIDLGVIIIPRGHREAGGRKGFPAFFCSQRLYPKGELLLSNLSSSLTIPSQDRRHV